MKRRGFLGLLAGAAVAPVLPKAFGAQELVRYCYSTEGAPLAPALPFSRANPGGLLTSAAFRAELLAGLNRIFEEEYRAHDPEWSKIFELQPDDEDEVVIYGFAPPP